MDVSSSNALTRVTGLRATVGYLVNSCDYCVMIYILEPTLFQSSSKFRILKITF